MVISESMSPISALNACKNRLSSILSETGHEFRFFSLATLQKQNPAPYSRMVVMRSFDSDWTIRFYTDFRSDKIGQLQQNPEASLLFWSSSERLQLRFGVHCKIHHQNKISEKAWDSIRGDSTKDYTSKISPGTVIDHPGEAYDWPDEPFSENFTVVDCIPYRLKVLQLDGYRHRSLQYLRETVNDTWQGSWIAP